MRGRVRCRWARTASPALGPARCEWAAWHDGPACREPRCLAVVVEPPSPTGIACRAQQSKGPCACLWTGPGPATGGGRGAAGSPSECARASGCPAAGRTSRMRGAIPQGSSPAPARSRRARAARRRPGAGLPCSTGPQLQVCATAVPSSAESPAHDGQQARCDSCCCFCVMVPVAIPVLQFLLLFLCCGSCCSCCVAVPVAVPVLRFLLLSLLRFPLLFLLT